MSIILEFLVGVILLMLLAPILVKLYAWYVEQLDNLFKGE